MSKVEALQSEDNLTQLERLFNQINTNGMQGHYGAVWPVIIRDYCNNSIKNYEYQYPRTFFEAGKRNEEINVFITNKKERVRLTKFILGKLMNSDIDIYLYHFAMYLIYGDYRHVEKMKEELTEAALGKKKAQYLKTLPVTKYMSTDDFITVAWSYLVKQWWVGDNEYREVPWMKDVRILFSREQFSEWLGTDYYNADWIEPVSGDLHFKCKTWTKESDPMAPAEIPDGWIEGPIILGHEGAGSGYRHFVNGVPVHAGAGIQVKFDKGWIDGRYEWSFRDKKDLIQIHAGDEVIFINEGHRVRVLA